MDFPESVPVKVIDAKHPEWQTHYLHWEKLRKLYEGGRSIFECAEEFLIKRSMEPGSVYNDRRARFAYINHLSGIIGWYISALFKDPPTIELRANDKLIEKPIPELSAFADDCDRSGRSLAQFWMQEVEPKSLVYGRAYILYDLPVVPPQASKLAQQAVGALRPMLKSYAPQDLINWQCDEQGKFQWAVLKLRAVTQDAPTQQPVSADRWYWFTQDQVAVYEFVIPSKEDNTSSILSSGILGDDSQSANANAKLIKVSNHALSNDGRVPIFRQELHKDHWLGDRISSPLVRLLNLENSHDWSLEQSNLALLAVFSDQEVNTIHRSEVGFLKLASGDKVEFIEQSGHAFTASQSRISELREEIFRLVYLVQQGRSSSATPASQSGVSKEADMLPARDVLSALGEIARANIQTILQTAADTMDLNLDVDVQGFSFLDRTETIELEVLQRADTISPINSTLYEKARDKRLVELAFPDMNREMKQAIFEQIDANPTPNELQQQQIEQGMAQRLKQTVALTSARAFPDAEAA